MYPTTCKTGYARDFDHLHAGFHRYTPGPRKEDVVRAVLESVVFNVVRMLEELSAETRASQVVLSGGLCEWEFVRSLCALLIDLPVLAEADSSNASLLGAARLAQSPSAQLPETATHLRARRVLPIGYMAEHDYPGKYRRWRAQLDQLLASA